MGVEANIPLLEEHMLLTCRVEEFLCEQPHVQGEQEECIPFVKMLGLLCR